MPTRRGGRIGVGSAQGVFTQAQHPPARHIDGGPGFHWIKRAYRLLQNLQRCTVPTHFLWLVDQHPEVTWAYWFYAENGNSRKKALLEAYLLTGASDDEIGRRFGVTAETVAAYEGVFFNVRDCLGKASYIEGTVLDPAFTNRFGGGTHELLWKRIGYHQGLAVLDAAVSGNGNGRPNRGSDVQSFVSDQALAGLKLQAALAIVAASDSPEAQKHLLSLYPQFDAIEQNQKSSASAHRQILTHVQAVVSAFKPTVASRFDKPDRSDPRTQYEMGGAELSAQEVINLRHGIPPDFADIDSSVFGDEAS